MQQTKAHRHTGRGWMVETAPRTSGLLQNLHEKSAAAQAARPADGIDHSGDGIALFTTLGYERMRRRQRENAGS
jgi:hypothetical protein